MKISMDGKGRWIDNLFIERLWRSLKYECVDMSELATGSEAQAGIGWWMNFYNEQRPHSSLDDRTPEETYTDGGAAQRPGLRPAEPRAALLIPAELDGQVTMPRRAEPPSPLVRYPLGLNENDIGVMAMERSCPYARLTLPFKLRLPPFLSFAIAPNRAGMGRTMEDITPHLRTSSFSAFTAVVGLPRHAAGS